MADRDGNEDGTRGEDGTSGEMLVAELVAGLSVKALPSLRLFT